MFKKSLAFSNFEKLKTNSYELQESNNPSVSMLFYF